MEKNACMSQFYNIIPKSLFGTESSVDYVDNCIAIKTLYNGVNYLPSRTEKENLTVMSCMKGDISKKDNTKLCLNDMENDLLPYQSSISYGKTICSVKYKDSFKENSKLHNSPTTFKLSCTDNCEGEDIDKCMPCFMQSSPVLPPPGQLPKTFQNYVSENPVFEMVADSLAFPPFPERKSTIVRLTAAAEGNVARNTLADVNNTASKPGKCGSGLEEELPSNLCKLVKSFESECGNDVTSAKSGFELGTIGTNKCLVGDSAESYARHCNKNNASLSVPFQKGNKTYLKPKQARLSKSDSCVNLTFSNPKVELSPNFNSPKPKCEKSAVNQKTCTVNDITSPRKSKPQKKRKKVTSVDASQSLTSERDMPQLIPLSDVSSDIEAKDFEQDEDDVVDVPDSPEMPVLIPFTSENEEPPQIKIECISDVDNSVSPVPSNSPPVHPVRGKVGRSKICHTKSVDYRKILAPLSSSSKGQLFTVYDIMHNASINKIFQPKVLLSQLSPEDVTSSYKGNCVKKKALRKTHKKKHDSKAKNSKSLFAKTPEKNKNVKSEEMYDKNFKGTEQKCYVQTFAEQKCESILEKTETVHEKWKEEMESDDISVKQLCPVKLENKPVDVQYKEDELLFQKTHTIKKETNFKSQPADLNEMQVECSEDPEVDVIDGVNFFSFHSKKNMDHFSENHGITFSCFEIEELDDSDGLEEHQEMIIPTKTTDITQIKGWRNKYFAPEAQFIKTENSVCESLLCTSDIDEDSFGKPETFAHDGLTSLAESTAEVMKPPEISSKSKNMASAFISDALENFLKNESKLQVSFLQEINPNISPIPPNASILSIGSLRKANGDSPPHQSARSYKNLSNQDYVKQCEDDALEGRFEAVNKSDWNSSGKEYNSDSELLNSSLVGESPDETPVMKKKIKLHEEIHGPQRLVLKFQKQGCGNRDGYKIADVSETPFGTDNPNINAKSDGAIFECTDGCPLPLIRKTMFTSKNDRKLLWEFLHNLNHCEKMRDFDAFNYKPNQVYFNCPVVNEKHIHKTLLSLPKSANVKSLLKKKPKTSKLFKKLRAASKNTPLNLSSRVVKVTGAASCNKPNESIDPRGKRCIRLPARYLDSALIVAGSEWVSPVSDIFEDESCKRLKKKKIDSTEKTDSLKDTNFEENILEQFPNATWSSENVLNSSCEKSPEKVLNNRNEKPSEDILNPNNDETGAGAPTYSSSQACVSDCWSTPCARTLIYSVFSKKLLCKCELPKVSDEIFSQKVAKSLSCKDQTVSGSTNQEGSTSVVSIGEDHSYSSRECVQTKSGTVSKTGLAACKFAVSITSALEENCVDSQNTLEKTTEPDKVSVPPASEGSVLKKSDTELNNDISILPDSSVALITSKSPDSVLKEVQSVSAKNSVFPELKNLSGENAAVDLLAKGNNNNSERNVVSAEPVPRLSAEKEVVKPEVSSPERNKYALLLVPMKAPDGTPPKCIQGKYIKVANSPTKLPPNVSVLSSTSLGVLKTTHSDGVSLLTNPGSACRTIGRVNLKGNLKTPLILKSLASAPITAPTNPVLSTSAVLCSSTKTVSSQESLQNTSISNLGGWPVCDQSQNKDISQCFSFPANSADSISNFSTNSGSFSVNSYAVSLADSSGHVKPDVKLNYEKSAATPIKLTSFKVGDKVVLYPPGKSPKNVKVMNKIPVNQKLPPSTVSGGQHLPNQTRSAAPGPTVVTISPTKNASFSVVDTANSAAPSVPNSAKPANCPEAVFFVAHDSENSSSGSVTANTVPKCPDTNAGETSDASATEKDASKHIPPYTSATKNPTLKDILLKGESDNVDVVTVEDDFDIVQILKRENENAGLQSSPALIGCLPSPITVEDSDISDETESEEENEESGPEKISETFAATCKSVKEKKRRQKISDAAEVLRRSSSYLENSTSLLGLLNGAVKCIELLKEQEMKLKCSKYCALRIRGAALARFRKLALALVTLIQLSTRIDEAVLDLTSVVSRNFQMIGMLHVVSKSHWWFMLASDFATEAPPAIRKESVMNLLRKMQAHRLLNPRVFGNMPQAANTGSSGNNVMGDSPAGTSMEFGRPLGNVKPPDDESNCQLRAMLLQNSVKEYRSSSASETDSQNCKNAEDLQSKNDGVPVDVKKVFGSRKQIWIDSCSSRFSVVPIENPVEKTKPEISPPENMNNNGASFGTKKVLNIKKRIWPDSIHTRYPLVPQENLTKEHKHEVSVANGLLNNIKSTALDISLTASRKRKALYESPDPRFLFPAKESSIQERKPEVSPSLANRSLNSTKEELSVKTSSVDDPHLGDINTNPLVVDMKEVSDEEGGNNSSPPTEKKSKRKSKEKFGVNVLPAAGESTEKKRPPTIVAKLPSQKNAFPGLIPLINAPHIRKQLLESRRNISIRSLHLAAPSGSKEAEKILCQTNATYSEDFRKRTTPFSLGGSNPNIGAASVTSHKPVNNFIHRNFPAFTVGGARTLKDYSNRVANYQQCVPQVKVENPHVRGVVSSSSSHDLGVNTQIPTEARTTSLTSPPTYVPILGNPYGFQKVNLNNGKTVLAYEPMPVSKLDYAPSKNTTIRKIILPPPLLPQVVKNQVSSVSSMSSTSLDCITQSTASVTQPCTFPSIVPDMISKTVLEKTAASLVEPVPIEPESGNCVRESLAHSASPTCDDVPLWVSTVTGESCIVTRINSDEEEEDSDLGTQGCSEEPALPTIVSCSTISEEKFYQDLEEEPL